MDSQAKVTINTQVTTNIIESEETKVVKTEVVNKKIKLKSGLDDSVDLKNKTENVGKNADNDYDSKSPGK